MGLDVLDLTTAAAVVAGAAFFLAHTWLRRRPGSSCQSASGHADTGETTPVIVGPGLARGLRRARARAEGRSVAPSAQAQK